MSLNKKIISTYDFFELANLLDQEFKGKISGRNVLIELGYEETFSNESFYRINMLQLPEHFMNSYDARTRNRIVLFINSVCELNDDGYLVLWVNW